MILTALLKVKNEQWVLPLTLPAMLMVVDNVVVLDHASTDRTPEIIAKYQKSEPERIYPIYHNDPLWKESLILQKLLETGREIGSTHFLLIDADEILTGNILSHVRNWTDKLMPGEAVRFPWLAMWRTLDRYRDDQSIWSDNFKSILFCDSPEVSFKAHGDGYDMHCGITDKDFTIHTPLTEMSCGGLMHLQFAAQRRLKAKHAWYKMTEAVRFPGRLTAEQQNKRYGRALDETGLRTTAVDPSWWEPYKSLRNNIMFEDESWHAAECRRLWNEYGPERFAGLELWGIPQGKDDKELAVAE